MSEPALHGLMARFDSAEGLVEAARIARAAGYEALDAFTPMPLEELDEALALRPSRIPAAVFVAGLLGAAGALFMQWYASVVDYPLNVGGRPLASWPSFIPVTFELTVLCAALTAAFLMLRRNRLPQLYHPVFAAPGFERASQDRFFLLVMASDPIFDPLRTRRFLEGLEAEEVVDVPR